MESAAPQRHGVAWSVEAHPVLKMAFNVLKQTCVSLTAPVAPIAAAQAAGAVPVTSSHVPPPTVASKQPLSVAHWVHASPRV
jgi:hypothetical protein